MLPSLHASRRHRHRDDQAVAVERGARRRRRFAAAGGALLPQVAGEQLVLRVVDRAGLRFRIGPQRVEVFPRGAAVVEVEGAC
jgi:hypothetical protein